MQELIDLLNRQNYKVIDPELLSWESWTNDLIKWSQQNYMSNRTTDYRYDIPKRIEYNGDKVVHMFKKYLALFVKEQNDNPLADLDDKQPIELNISVKKNPNYVNIIILSVL